MEETLTQRSRLIKQGTIGKGSVVYWMSRDQRVSHNWALIFASRLAKEKKVPLRVVFCLVPNFLEATSRQYYFMLKGLKHVEQDLKTLNIPFHLLLGSPEMMLPEFCMKYEIETVVSDFDPLRIKRQWKKAVAEALDITFYTVDAHNIVPAYLVSDKTEFGAYTLRPKINRLLPVFLHAFPEPEYQVAGNGLDFPEFNREVLEKNLQINILVREVDGWISGEEASQIQLRNFIHQQLSDYADKRNDPALGLTSQLSPYLHFGQLSAQFAAQYTLQYAPESPSRDSFLEELIVRRELADNFCLYNSHYDSFLGFPEWARKTLDEHRADPREFLYSPSEFEEAHTHDPLWNAAQLEMVQTGRMHGYMRMYWAKKILEWTSTPEEALKTAIYLNDKYELDGRDPNGYAGCAWAIGGVHDRAWNSHPVYGKIRYMNDNGCKRKFDVQAYLLKNKRIGQ